MVKGVSRRVIVVRSPDRRLFEEAIFIVREGAAAGGGVTAEQVVEEARRVAGGFVRDQRRWRGWLAALGYMALGALAASGAWGAALLL